VNRWERIERVDVPGGGVMELLRRGESELAIHVDGRELMNSRVHGSEDALALVPCGRIKHREDARVLIGGLGMGFTLAAALRTVGPEAEVTLAELVPAVVAWSHGPIGPVAGHPLRDPRVVVRIEDVGEVIRSKSAYWDAILLDVDNGPEGLTRSENDWLYGAAGLARIKAAIRPGGLVAFWSAAPHAAFTRRLGHAGFRVEETTVRARGAKGGQKHTIWLATVPAR
jgi:spermidine synthase